MNLQSVSQHEKLLDYTKDFVSFNGEFYCYIGLKAVQKSFHPFKKELMRGTLLCLFCLLVELKGHRHDVPRTLSKGGELHGASLFC